MWACFDQCEFDCILEPFHTVQRPLDSALFLLEVQQYRNASRILFWPLNLNEVNGCLKWSLSRNLP